jgi:ubiquinone biosynthesis accessory factor UbiJ
MLAPLVTHFLQHLTQQNNWARPYLIPFSGKVVLFDFSLIQNKLLILEDGSLSIAGETADADATVHIPPSLALRLLANDTDAKSYIRVDGDTHLATEVSKVLQNMRWDIEEDISKVVGDIGAYKISQVTQKTLETGKKQAINLAEMLAEYWQEEKNILAKKTHVESFNSAVDELKNDVDRLEKRINKALTTLKKPNKPTQESSS